MSHQWVSNGRSLDYSFLNWLRHTPTLIIPNFKNAVFPFVRFTDKRKLVTLNWDDSTLYYNVNRHLFPNVETVSIIGKTKPLRFSDFHFETGNFYYFYNHEHQIQWKEKEWVNEEWLSSQFNQFFVRCQQIIQNELRKELK
jgi:hypothetical protein